MQFSALDDADESVLLDLHFANYAQREKQGPSWLWPLARALTLFGTTALLALVVLHPRVGLLLFWGVVVPSVPLVLVVAPGLWRQVCPMAFMNQVPRSLGFSLGKTLPERWQKASFGVAVTLFMGAVALRAPWLNHSGAGVVAVLGGMLALAFTGGLVFKGRSGWCGTFCPLGPIQRAYGQAPVTVVRNGYCPTCVGCQQNCYDFSPRTAIFNDIEHDDPRHARMRQWFFGLLPGLIIGFFLQGPGPAASVLQYELGLFGGAAASLAVYAALARALPRHRYRLSLAFAVIALMAFYWFTGPGIVGRLSHLLSLPQLAALKEPAHGLGLVAGGLLLFYGLQNERMHRVATATKQAAEDRRKAQWRTIAIHPVTVVNRADGKQSQVMPGQRLTDALRQQGTMLPTGCGVGMCGGDAVAICEGMENLPPPCEQEKATLRRMGLEGKARLACVCEVTSPIEVDTRHEALREALDKSGSDSTSDTLHEQGIERVVVIGNGVAGVTVTETLRRHSPSVHLTVISDEAQPFYNRMALAELLPNPANHASLHMRSGSWADDWRVDLKLHTPVAGIDRVNRQVKLVDGGALPYDRLVLAMGADAAKPNDDFDRARNAFVLRKISDVQAIHDHVKAHSARRAVVVGGGVLGVEAALALRHWGLQVHLIERAPHLMAAQLDPAGAQRLADALRQQHIEVSTGVQQMDWVMRDQAEPPQMSHLVLDGAEQPVQADLFLACLGIRPRTKLALAAELTVGPRGITVDAEQRTNDPAILAVGDVAQPTGPAGLWTVATDHAERAVKGMLGQAMDEATAPITFKLKTDLLDVSVWGQGQPQAGDEVDQSADDSAVHWRVIWRDGRQVGWLCVGQPGSSAEVGKALQAGTRPQVVQALQAL
ncbi:MAG: hypothetical protein RI907_777 [Pseudomonadota bacterium]